MTPISSQQVWPQFVAVYVVGPTVGAVLGTVLWAALSTLPERLKSSPYYKHEDAKLKIS